MKILDDILFYIFTRDFKIGFLKINMFCLSQFTVKNNQAIWWTHF